ncbi:PadR family transcriptional regulator [Saccharothrix obliqua]|uniref:PadR family transcriptional regulator n=1 Tax=Saccharothrix obliqua TaxID=2861747 RepID=UPI001C5FD975|nr:helix-turn-helix transcriptional regulator [Saccharothrix obliqua]MBW4718040.1 PadR family transcriptional regulator [Saccharothrix obliqua]
MAAAKLTPLGMAVLELLHERPMHPYEMAQLMRERYVDARVKLRAGSLYHTVERLQGTGYVEVVDTRRDGRRPERTVYGMTAAGRDAFEQRGRELLGDLEQEYPAYLSGLAVVDELGPDIAISELEHRVMRLRAAVASDQAVVDGLRADGTPEVYWLDWRFAAARRAFELTWTEQLLDELRAGRLRFPDCKPKLSLIAKEDNERATN